MKSGLHREPSSAARGGPALWRSVPPWVRFGMLPFTFAVVVAMVVTAVVYVRTSSAGSISPLWQLMGLSDGTGASAPGFQLTDQHGQTIGLNSFRGKAVLVSFMDDRCTEVCPVLAHEFALADRDLGADARRVALVGVNVNPTATSVADLTAFDRLHGLASLPNWYFLTGNVPTLRAVWKAYGIYVELPKGATQTVHADYLYFLDPAGRERYLASPMVDQRPNGTGYLPANQLDQWGQGIAHFLRTSLTR